MYKWLSIRLPQRADIFLKGLLLLAALQISACSSNDQAGLEESTGLNFELQSSHGPVSLSQFRGKVVLLFFGYTHCPDICPTTMTHVGEAMDLLDKREQEQVQPLFITVDPERDSAEYLAKYVHFFHPKLIGLSGTAEQISRVAKKFSVEYFRDKKSGTDKGEYLMNHTSYLFLIDGKGKVADMMSSFTKPADIAASVRKFISR